MHRQRLWNSSSRLKPIYSDNAAKSHRDRPPTFLRCRDESHWGRGSSDLRSVAQQSSRKRTPTVPATGRGNGQVQRHQDPPEVCCRPRLHPQSFQPGTSSLQSRELQTQSLRRFGRVASTCSLSVLDCWLYWSDQVSLTMPPGRRALITSSNDIGANPIIMQRILRPALAMEVYDQFVQEAPR